jgi:hypothetical protein
MADAGARRLLFKRFLSVYTLHVTFIRSAQQNKKSTTQLFNMFVYQVLLFGPSDEST